MWTTCRDAYILRLVFYNNLEKYKSVVIRQYVYVTFT